MFFESPARRWRLLGLPSPSPPQIALNQALGSGSNCTASAVVAPPAPRPSEDPACVLPLRGAATAVAPSSSVDSPQIKWTEDVTAGQCSDFRLGLWLDGKD
ncbi:hypothetical protein OPV22_023659 [Ensete ventricosum]|uniref:Uncharacterized protein n=1 Tax=Ensete ventricosum TaxID=4639 RepID=A0AAV8QW20_ENSVE|nr:hypothetical protein OPV22_023659 [Ensete ventricosum]